MKARFHWGVMLMTMPGQAAMLVWLSEHGHAVWKYFVVWLLWMSGSMLLGVRDV